MNKESWKKRIAERIKEWNKECGSGRKRKQIGLAAVLLLGVAALLTFWPQPSPQGPAGDPDLVGIELGNPAGLLQGSEQNSGGEAADPSGDGTETKEEGEKLLPEGLLEELQQAINGQGGGFADSVPPDGQGGASSEPDETSGLQSGSGAERLVQYMKDSYPGWHREDSAQTDQRQYAFVEYFAGDSYESKNLWGSAEQTAKFTYHYLWEGSSRFQDQHQGKEPDLAAQAARIRAMLYYLLGDRGEEAYQDFLAVAALNYQDRRWYSRTAWYGDRLLQLSIQSGTVTGTVYPAGYTDEINGLPQKGETEELWGDDGLLADAASGWQGFTCQPAQLCRLAGKAMQCV